MLSIRVARPPAPGDVVVARELEAAASKADGHESLGAAVWRDLAHPGPDSFTIVAQQDSDPAGLLHCAPNDTFRAPHLAAGLVVHPEHRAGSVTGALLAALVAEIAGRGGGRVVLWVAGVDETMDAATARAGFRRAREQLQMRVPLPVAEPVTWPAGVTVRTFVPGEDDAEWLTVNNRAFRNHPEQGNWVEATLQRRMAERWFDPSGLLLAFDAAGLAGFCWTKVHEPDAAAKRVGEIFVVGVDPDRQGTHLGRALVLGGLEHLARERGCREGMLYVDAANAPALALYHSLGFASYRTDRAYEQEISRQ